MTRSFPIAIILLGICFFAAQAQLKDTRFYYSGFKSWVAQNNLQYGIEELAFRFNNWMANLDEVTKQNELELPFKLEMNDFAAMSSEEFSALHLGFSYGRHGKKNNNKKQNNDAPKKATNTTSYDNLPKSVDWRKQNAVTPILNQGSCGACWTFSTAGALEGLHAIKHNKLVSLSKQQMLDCSESYGNFGCDGGLMVNGFNYTRDHGIQLDSDYGYIASKDTCNYDSKKVVFKNAGWEEVPQNNSLALKAAVAKQPVSIGVEASGFVFQLFKSGVITHGCGTEPDHAVLIVGYDTMPDGTEYWIVKNSWGAKWGQNGYLNIAMGDQNNGAGVCGINMAASYPTL